MKFCNKCCKNTERRKNGECAECAKIRCARWREKNKSYAAAKRKEWRLNNPSREADFQSTYYSKNKDKRKKSIKAWRDSHPNEIKIYRQNRRAATIGDNSKLSQGIKQKLFILQKGKCPCCLISLGDDYQLDHIIPLKLGGKNEDSNIQLLRKECNNKKRAKHPIVYMQSKGFLL